MLRTVKIEIKIQDGALVGQDQNKAALEEFEETQKQKCVRPSLMAPLLYVNQPIYYHFKAVCLTFTKFILIGVYFFLEVNILINDRQKYYLL